MHPMIRTGKVAITLIKLYDYVSWSLHGILGIKNMGKKGGINLGLSFYAEFVLVHGLA